MVTKNTTKEGDIKPVDIITVGLGEYGTSVLAPTLQIMQEEGLVRLIATVDIKQRSDALRAAVFDQVDHRVRESGQGLSDLLSDFKKKDPIVILGHSNDCHTPDAVDLATNGFRVIVEKPYFVNSGEAQVFCDLVLKQGDAVALAEYYLAMKVSPLLLFAGNLHQDSFYFNRPGLLVEHEGIKQFGTSLHNLVGMIKEIIGAPRFVYVDVLEGEGSTGRVDHRGEYLVNRKKGGGMIQDLGIHALSPLFAIEEYIGAIDKDFSGGDVRTAVCKEYEGVIQEKFHLPPEDLGETYAEMRFETSKGVPAIITIGKYVLPQKNQRRVLIVGDEGHLMHDMSTCTLYVSHRDNAPVRLIEAPKLPGSKYYPVIRACLEQLEGKSPFLFDFTGAALGAQECALRALMRAIDQGPDATYRAGASPKNIFSPA